MTKEAAINYIRQSAKDGEVSLLDVGDGEPFKKLVTLRQVLKCLEEGEISGDAKINENNDFECRLYRYGAGVYVYVDVIIYTDNNDDLKVLAKNVEVEI